MPDFPGTLKPPRLASAPSSPVVGQMFYDTANNQLKWWNGTSWIVATGTGALPADTVVVAGTRIIANKLLAGDAQPVYQLMGDGRQNWGLGGSTAVDTNLYRAGADILRTDDSFQTGGSLNVGTSLIINSEIYQGNASWFINSQGYHQWGPGDWSRDTNLYRRGAGTLQTDGSFYIYGNANGLGLLQGSDTYLRFQITPNGTLFWGPGNAAGDVNMYRSSPNILFVTASAGLYCTHAFNLDYSGTGAALYFGSSYDTYLYRRSANVLGTNGDISVRNNVSAWVYIGDDGSGNASLRFGQYLDTNLYRMQSDTLRTDDQLVVGQQIYAHYGDAYQMSIGYSAGYAGLVFGSAADTNLYRAAAGLLQIDGQLNVVGKITNASLPSRIAQGSQEGGTTVSDWNNATLSGWYDGSGAANAPPGETGWLQGMVVTHRSFSPSYLTQEVWRMFDPAMFRWRRYRVNDSWSAWRTVYDDATQDAALPTRLQATAPPINDYNTALSDGWYIAAQGSANEPPSASYRYYMLHVINWTTGVHCIQLAYSLFTDEVWYRRLVNGNWGSWSRGAGGANVGGGTPSSGASPPASPVTGDRWITNFGAWSQQWEFIYRPDLDATYPWMFVGGPPLVHSSTSGVASVTVPRAGVYAAWGGGRSNVYGGGGDAHVYPPNGDAAGFGNFAAHFGAIIDTRSAGGTFTAVADGTAGPSYNTSVLCVAVRIQ